MNILKQVYIYGDSILRGILLDYKNKHYYPMANNNIKELENHFPIKIENKSKFGRTIDKGYKEIKRMLSKNTPCDIAILEYGGNDCDHKWGEIGEDPSNEHKPNTPIEIFESTYFQIITELKRKKIEPVIMSLPPIDSEKYFNWITSNGANEENVLTWLKDKQHIAHYQEMYSLSATKVALETNCLFIDVRSEFLKHRDYRDLMCEDGIHPNEKGHKLIAKVFSEFASNYFLDSICKAD